MKVWRGCKWCGEGDVRGGSVQDDVSVVVWYVVHDGKGVALSRM